MKERAVRLGKEQNLVAILSEPEIESRDAPTVVLLNAGLVHRVGPNRLNVDIARQLAAKGFKCARFDMSGIGDSDRPDEGRPFAEQSLADVGQVLDDLSEQLGARSFMLIGLCTGAYNALAAAEADQRVSGCVLIDGHAYPNTRFRIKNQARRITQLWRWVRYIRRVFGVAAVVAKPPTDDVVVFETQPLPKERFAEALATLIDRKAGLLLAYTGLGPQPFNYRRQLHDVFPALNLEDHAKVLFFPRANHTFTLPGHRERLIDEIDSWICEKYPMVTAARPIDPVGRHNGRGDR
jgi:pimeloyl-ACP methyl ester carboxylesterase